MGQVEPEGDSCEEESGMSQRDRGKRETHRRVMRIP